MQRDKDYAAAWEYGVFIVARPLCPRNRGKLSVGAAHESLASVSRVHGYCWAAYPVASDVNPPGSTHYNPFYRFLMGQVKIVKMSM